MADPESPLLAEAKEEIARLKADLGQMGRLRWRLAMLELRAAAGSLRRLATVVAVTAIMGLSALPVLIVWAANLLDGRLGISGTAWLLIFALGLLGGAVLAGWLSWRRFRREFVGMEETLEEFREDAVWLGEWLGESERDAADD